MPRVLAATLLPAPVDSSTVLLLFHYRLFVLPGFPAQVHLRAFVRLLPAPRLRLRLRRPVQWWPVVVQVLVHPLRQEAALVVPVMEPRLQQAFLPVVPALQGLLRL